MAFSKSFIVAFFAAFAFLGIDIGVTARHLLQTSPPNIPTVPGLPKPTLPPPMPTLPMPKLPPLPSIPTQPQPKLPPFPSFPTGPNVPKVTLPPFPINIPPISSFPFFSPPPSTTSP